MKPVILLVCFVGVALLELAVCQDQVNCSDIGETVQPMTGMNITDTCPTIRVEDLQCCTEEFIQDSREEAEEQFVEGLRDELMERFTVARQILRLLREHLNGTFLENYFGQFSSLSIFSQLLQTGRGKRQSFFDRVADRTRSFAEGFRERFFDGDDEEDDGDRGEPGDGGNNGDNDGGNDGGNDGDDMERRRRPGNFTDEMDFIDNLIRGPIENAVNSVRGQGRRIEDCVKKAFERNFNEVNEEINARGLENVELAMQIIDRLEELLDNITSTLAGFRPIPRCVGRLVELNTCGRCTAPRPPFCQNVCGALARACYSPFEDALDDQLEGLWDLIREVIGTVDDTLDKLEDFDLIDVNPQELLSELRDECTLDIDLSDVLDATPTDGPGRKRRQEVTEPEGDMNDGDEDDADSDGVGKKLRLPAIIRRLANSLARGPFGYPGRVLPGLCGRLRRAVRRRNCWGGDEDLDEDIPEFTGDGIDEQDQNPIIQIPIDELQAAAAALETPVTDLTQDPEFQAALPQTLESPTESVSEAPGSASGLAVSVASLSFSLLLAMFMF